MGIRVPSQSDLSEPSSENLARKVRHDQSRARQKRRQAETKSGTETRRTRKESPLKRWPSNKFGVNGPSAYEGSLTPEELAEARARFNRPRKKSQSQSQPHEFQNAATTTERHQPKGMFKRSLHFLYDNFLPKLNVPEYPPSTGSFSNAPGAYPGSFTQPRAHSGPMPQLFPGWSSCGTPNGSFSNAPGAYPGSFTQPQPRSHSQFRSQPKPGPRCEQTTPSEPMNDNEGMSDESLSPSSSSGANRSSDSGSFMGPSSGTGSSDNSYTGAESDFPPTDPGSSFSSFTRERDNDLNAERDAYEKRRARKERKASRETLEDWNERLMREYLDATRRLDRKYRMRKEREAEYKRMGREEEYAREEVRRAEEKERKRREKRRADEEERERRRAFNARQRERTSTSRSTHSRSHPYGRAHSGRHFNPASHINDSTSFKPIDPLVVHFEWYENQWAAITSLSGNTSLDFSSIPWPLLIIPRSAADVTPERVREFVHHAMCRATQMATARTKKEERFAAKNELKNWHPDKFTTRVLARVLDEKEREVVRAAADVVQKTLTALVAAL